MSDQVRARRAGRPSTADAERLNDRILSAASQCFVERGFADATVELIAQRSETTRRSIWHRYATKEDLLIAVCKRHIEAYLAAIVTLPADISQPIERLRLICKQMLHTAIDPASVSFNILIAHELRRCPQLGELAIAMNEALINELVTLILEAQCVGHFQNFRARALSHAMIGMMLSNPTNRSLYGNDPGFRDPHQTDLYFSDMWAIIAALM